MSDSILVSRAGDVLRLSLNRPKRCNAMDLEMGRQLVAEFDQASADTSVRMVILTGEGSVFSAGGDIKAMAELTDHPAFFREISDLVHHVVLKIREMPQPVLAVLPGPVSGVAFGLVTACDLRIASDNATFHAGTTTLGLAPNGGLTYFLPRLIGRGRAERMILTAQKIDAHIAFEWGLIDGVTTSQALEAEAQGWCERLRKMAPLAQGRFKGLLYGDDSDLGAQLDRERDAISESSDSADFREGMAAFLAKRAPDFKGQ